MLSILIPVYQYDVTALVRTLQQQAQQLSIPWEILCLDDGSDAFWQARNRVLGQLPGVRYEELASNVGRARIRNELARRARFPFLQFMDADSGVVRGDFLAVYARQLQAETVLCGGRVYATERPADFTYALHWLYGTEREAKPADRRGRHPHQSFMTNNFVVPASILQRIPFDERLTQYGHEDTLFGQELEQAGIPVQHLDNPLEHVGLETAAQFLHKARQAVDNLAFLRKQGNPVQTRLIDTYDDLKRRGFLAATAWALACMEACFRKNLLSRYPDLRIFDAWRLGLFIQAMRA